MNKVIQIIFITAIFGFSACNKVINQDPEGVITSQNFWKNADHAEAGIVGCYDALQGLPRDLVMWGERGVTLTSTAFTPAGLNQFLTNNITPTSDVSWAGFYNVINRTNQVLAYVPGIEDPALNSRRERILGEAYFLRAYCYFMLGKLWANVPIILTPTTGEQNFNVSQSPVSKVWEQVDADLAQARMRLPASYATAIETKGRATIGAWRAVYTDYMMWRAGTENKPALYAQVADTTLAIINTTGLYSLVTGANYGTIFTNRNTLESIFELQFNNANQETNNLLNLFGPRGGTVIGGEGHAAPRPNVISAYASNDLRRAITVGVTTTPLYAQSGLNYVTKYTGTIVGGTRISDNNLILYRLAHIILLRAEALNEMTQTQAAITLLNQIRNRAGLAVTTAVSQADVRSAIFDERLRELAFEGFAWYDLVRTGRTGFSGSDQYKLILPVAASELLLNPNLVQNPGYF